MYERVVNWTMKSVRFPNMNVYKINNVRKGGKLDYEKREFHDGPVRLGNYEIRTP